MRTLIYIFQTKYKCPKCGSYQTERTSQNKDKQYRKCKKCLKNFCEFAKIDAEFTNKSKNPL